MKKIVFVWVILFGFFAFSISALAEETSDYLVYDWEYRPEAGMNSAEITDLNNDGVLELIASSSDGIVYDLDEASKGHMKWQYRMTGNIKALLVLDFDKDGEKEVIAGSDNQGISIRVLNWQGFEKGSTILFESPVNELAVGDFDGDGINDLGVASLRTIHALRFTKSEEKEIWDYQTNGTVYYMHMSDYNGDGKDELLYASSWNEDGKEYGDVVMLSAAGKRIWEYGVKGGFPFAVADFVASYDIDSNGKDEIIVGSKTSGVAVLDVSGNTMWSYATEKQVNLVYVSALSGVSGPVIFLGATPYVYALNSQGSLVWKYPLNTTVYSMLVKDLNRDGGTEVLIGTNKYLHIVSDKGARISSIEYGRAATGSQAFAPKSVDVRGIAAGELGAAGIMKVAVAESWSESRQDHNYYFGNIDVYAVNEKYMGSGSATTTTVRVTTSTQVLQTTTTKGVEATTTTTTATSDTTTPSTGGGGGSSTAIILGLIVAGGLMLALVAVVLFVLMKKKA